MPTHDGGEHTFDRARFLRLGAVAMAGAAVTPGVARAGAPTPVPGGDDVAYVQFAATAELVATSVNAAMLAFPGFTASDKRRLRALRVSGKEHRARLAAVLGADAPQFGDFHITAAPRTRPGLVAAATEVAGLLAGTYLSAVTDTADPATRELLGRLLWSEAQSVCTLRVLARLPPSGGGLPAPISLDDAAPRLDAFLGDAEPPA